MTKICFCGISFNVPSNNPNKVFCSRKCGQKNWRERNRERVSKTVWQWQKNRLHTDIEYRLKFNARARIRRALQRAIGRPHVNKGNRTHELIGCSLHFFKHWIESQWLRGMNWDNYGSSWHIDHRIPLAKLNLADPAQRKIAFHYSNQAPMWAEDNLSKKDSIVPTTSELPMFYAQA